MWSLLQFSITRCPLTLTPHLMWPSFLAASTADSCWLMAHDPWLMSGPSLIALFVICTPTPLHQTPLQTPLLILTFPLCSPYFHSLAPYHFYPSLLFSLYLHLSMSPLLAMSPLFAFTIFFPFSFDYYDGSFLWMSVCVPIPQEFRAQPCMKLRWNENSLPVSQEWGKAHLNTFEFLFQELGRDWLMHGIVPTFLVLIASMPHSLQLWYLRVSEVFQMTHNNWKRPRGAQIYLLIDWRRITLIWGRCFSDSGWLAFRHFRDSYSFVLMDSMEGQQLDLPWS